jgi:chromosomal replication initiation ATPase DnaA
MYFFNIFILTNTPDFTPIQYDRSNKFKYTYEDLSLLYADDTLLFSETYEEMQNLLDVFSDYCKLWKLEVNLIH